MKLTKTKLQQMIKEELGDILETPEDEYDAGEYAEEIAAVDELIQQSGFKGKNFVEDLQYKKPGFYEIKRGGNWGEGTETLWVGQADSRQHARMKASIATGDPRLLGSSFEADEVSEGAVQRKVDRLSKELEVWRSGLYVEDPRGEYEAGQPGVSAGELKP